MKRQYKLIIKPITPVHIGNGNELTPLDYNLINAKQGIRYAVFSTDRILSHIINDTSKRAFFDNAASSGNMKILQDFFHKNMMVEDIEYLSEVTDEFSRIYEYNRQKDPYENAAKVQQIYREAGSKKPVIPGSAIKGSIRTALLNKLLYDVPDKDYDQLLQLFSDERVKKRFDAKLQRKLLNNYENAKQDPFRCLEVLDCSFERKGTQLVGVLKNISANNNQIEALDKMQIMAETIKGSMNGSDVSAKIVSAETNIRINEDLQNSNTAVSMKLSMDMISRSCNEFYFTQFENEYNKFYKNTNNPECDKILDLKNKLIEIKDSNTNSFIMRIGRWSQIEFVTFGSHFRTPRTRSSKEKALGYGGTRTVFNVDGCYLPMGWCKCTFEELH